MAERLPERDDLALQAFLYSSSEMSDPERDAFEGRLAVDQATRDAVADAVRLSELLADEPARPDPAYRSKVRERLQPRGWRGLLARRSYRGHPLLWLTTGAAAALLFVFLRPAPDEQPTEPPIVQTTPLQPEADPRQGEAFIWAELSSPEHVVKTHAEESKRKSRVEDRRQTRRGMNLTTDQ